MGLDFMQDDSAVKQRVIEIIAEQALINPRDVRPDMGMSDLGLDSLGLVECIFAIEESFDVSVPFNANNPEEGSFDISSVASIIGEVEKLIAQQHG